MLTFPSSRLQETHGAENVDPHYQLILHEELRLYIDGSFKQVYDRILEKDNDEHFIGYKLSLGEGWLSDTLDLFDMNILGNQLMLSWLATKEANGLQHVSEYISSLQVLTPDTLPSTGQQISTIAEKVFRLKETNGQSPVFRRFTKMMQIADLGVTDVFLGYHDDSDFQFPESVSSEIQKAFINENRWDFKLFHKAGNLDKPLGLPLQLESQGTQVLVKIVPYLFQALENGSFLAYDEISTAIHPELLKFLVNLFQDPKSNSKGAQLLFTTQDASIASSDTLRADQVWFVEKKNGSSDLYSAQDFEGVTIRAFLLKNGIAPVVLELSHLSAMLIIFSMKMSRKLKNNIVIVCEGTETEYHYLKELKSIVEERQPERFSDIRIIPTPEELNVCVKRNRVTQKRSLKGSSKAGLLLKNRCVRKQRKTSDAVPENMQTIAKVQFVPEAD